MVVVIGISFDIADIENIFDFKEKINFFMLDNTQRGIIKNFKGVIL